MNWFVAFLSLALPVSALTIQVDYTYDTNGFFDDPEARTAIEAVAARWSRVINQELLAVDVSDNNLDPRFAFSHPSTGREYQVSSAASPDTDRLANAGAPEADEYRGRIVIPEDVWILYVGGRNLASIATGGATAGGVNFIPVEENPEGLLNRGFNSGEGSLTVVGGSVSFDLGSSWHFGLTTPAPEDQLDFYSVALHEVGHGLGLAADEVVEWAALVENGLFIGPRAVSIYNEVSGENVVGLRIQGEDDFHFEDGQHRAPIFEAGSPNLVGTVGLGVPQRLAMEFSANFGATIRRFEITVVDLAALEDIGWSVIANDPGQGFPSSEVKGLTISSDSMGRIVLNFPSQVGFRYEIQTSLGGRTWRGVQPRLDGTGFLLSWADGQGGFTDPNPPASGQALKFYRVREIPN